MEAALSVRRARTADVRGIRRLIDTYIRPDRRLLSQGDRRALRGRPGVLGGRPAGDGAVVGCGALHVMWEDLAEIRTVAVDPALPRPQDRPPDRRRAARRRRASWACARVFVLTFETGFFGSFGFVEIDGAPVPPAVYEQLLRSYDEGVAEFLDLERVKPNTLGNTRMLLHL